MSLRIGLLINPLAGIGGPLALKGSDSEAIVAQALAEGAECKSNQRVAVCLQNLGEQLQSIQWFSAPGLMGQTVLEAQGINPEVVGQITSGKTTAEDTIRIAAQLADKKIDLLLFAGGDGTARNIVDSLALNKPQQLVLGIPAGVKMHSGVYAISPQAAARVIMEFMQQQPVSIASQEVRDIDEDKLRAGQVQTRYYGELMTPSDERFVQQVKQAGELDDSAMQLDIAAGIVDTMDNETLYIVGAGTTPKALMDELGLDNTLLGVDVVLGRQLIASDVDAKGLLTQLDAHPYHPVKMIITPTGGQGHIIGRGNQQLSASLLERVGKENMLILVTPEKLAALKGRPLLMDSGDSELDQHWQGWISIITGYQQQSVYPLSCGAV